MATIRERTKRGTRVFHVQIRMSGFPPRTASFPTRRLAERWATTVEAEMIEGRHFRHAAAGRKTVADAIERYARDELPKNKDAANPAIRLAWWKKRLGAIKLADVSPALLADCKSELANSPYTRARPDAERSELPKGAPAPQYPRAVATVNRYMAALARVFTVARREWHWTAANPFESVSRFKEGRGSVRILVGDEQARLLAQTVKDPQLHLMVILALSTPRAGEITALDWRDIDLATGRLTLRDTKNGQDRTAFAFGKALSLLTAWHEAHGKPASGAAFSSAKGRRYRHNKPFRAACAAAGIEDFRFHDLRHSAATYLAREGATEQQLKAIGGWKSNVVSRYVHLAAADAQAVLRKTVDKMDRAGSDDANK